MTVVNYQGITHECDDPECHVQGFVTTLEYKNIISSAGTQDARAEVREQHL